MSSFIFFIILCSLWLGFLLNTLINASSDTKLKNISESLEFIKEKVISIEKNLTQPI